MSLHLLHRESTIARGISTPQACTCVHHANVGEMGALIDVDLYLPTLASLETVFPKLVTCGDILVDASIENSIFDGSLQALSTFCAQHGLTYRIEGGKLGVLRK